MVAACLYFCRVSMLLFNMCMLHRPSSIHVSECPAGDPSPSELCDLDNAWQTVATLVRMYVCVGVCSIDAIHAGSCRDGAIAVNSLHVWVISRCF